MRSLARMAAMLAACMSMMANAQQPVPDEAAEAASPVCELHLWGARKSFPPGSRFAAVAAPKGSAHADRSRPLANINVLDPVQRLEKVPDETFEALFEEGASVKVVRHAEALDLEQVKRLKRPLSERADQPCHADLVLSELTDIDFPNGAPSTGILDGLLMARGGMHMRIAFARYGLGGQQLVSQRKKVRGDLAVGRSQWQRDTRAALDSVNSSVAQGILIFARDHGPFAAAH